MPKTIIFVLMYHRHKLLDLRLRRTEHLEEYILWHNRPMRELLKFRNMEDRDCATVVERCRALPPLPSPRLAPHRALLGYAVNTGSRNSKEGPRDLRDVTRNNTMLRSQRVRLQRVWG
jgi:hypothetical protein